MTQPVEKLTFDLAGDVCLAAQEGDLTVADLPRTHAEALGPLLELRHVRPDFLFGQSWLTTTTYASLLRTLGSPLPVWYEPELGRQGFITINKLNRDQTAWPDFMIRSKRAAKAAGFADDHAARLRTH